MDVVGSKAAALECHHLHQPGHHLGTWTTAPEAPEAPQPLEILDFTRLVIGFGCHMMSLALFALQTLSLLQGFSTASTRLAFDWLPESPSSDRFEITFHRRCFGISYVSRCPPGNGRLVGSMSMAHRTATFRSLHSETAASGCPSLDRVVWPRLLPAKHLVKAEMDIENG